MTQPARSSMPPEGRFTTPTPQHAVFFNDFNDEIITNAMCVREALIEVDLISASLRYSLSCGRVVRHFCTPRHGGHLQAIRMFLLRACRSAFLHPAPGPTCQPGKLRTSGALGRLLLPAGAQPALPHPRIARDEAVRNRPPRTPGRSRPGPVPAGPPPPP